MIVFCFTLTALCLKLSVLFLPAVVFPLASLVGVAISTCMTPIGCMESINTWIDSVKAKYPVLKECKFFLNQKPIPNSPYVCFPDVSEPMQKGKFLHDNDQGKMDENLLDDRLGFHTF